MPPQWRRKGRTPEFLLAPAQSRMAAYQFVGGYVAANGRPDGLLCVNDEMAMGAHRALWDQGMRVPEDVALVGCDGIPEAEYAHPPLTRSFNPLRRCAGWPGSSWSVAWKARQPRPSRRCCPPSC